MLAVDDSPTAAADLSNKFAPRGSAPLVCPLLPRLSRFAFRRSVPGNGHCCNFRSHVGAEGGLPAKRISMCGDPSGGVRRRNACNPV